MKKLFPILMIAAITFYLYSCEKEIPTQESIPDVETNKPLYLEDNPINPDKPEATVALKSFPLRKNVTTVTEDPPAATLVPAELSEILAAGESITEHKTLTLPADVTPPKADIMFALDLTGSMWEELSNVKTNSINIMNELSTLIPDTYFGAISYMDYPGYFSSCGYSRNYGYSDYGCGDYPYSLDQGLTTTLTDVENAINGLSDGCGADGPESYTRVFWESWNDAGIGWRTGAKKFLINWGDNIPHDCDFGAGCEYSGSTGVDPGRDATAGTADDITIAGALQGMADNNIALLALHSNEYAYLDLWDCYASKTGTGGDAVQIKGDGTIPGDVPGEPSKIAEYIAGLVEAAIKQIDNLQLQVCTPGFEDWLVDGGVTYTDIYLDEEKTFEFDIEIQVPEGTEDGEYEFKVCAVGDGVEYAYQDVIITVRNTVDVSLDVKPTSCPNPFNMKAKGTLPAAILGTADFDVTQIDASTVTLMGVPATRSNLEDVAAPYTGDALVDRDDCTTDGPDRFTDMTFKFDRQAVAAALGGVADGDVVVVEINGQLLDGTDLVGQDVIWIKKKK